MMAYLRGDFSNRWLRRCARNSPASFLNCNSLVDNFIPSNLFGFKPTTILSDGFLMFLSYGLWWIRLDKLEHFLKTSFKMILLKKSWTRSPIVLATKGITGASVWKPLKNEFTFPATILKNFSLAVNKGSCIMLFNLVKVLFLPSGCSFFSDCRYEW